MANDMTSERLWVLDTAGATSTVAAETPVIVRKVVYVPTTVDDDVVIQEYGPTGAARSAIVLKASHLDIGPVSLDFGRNGRRLNGFNLSVIDHGTVYIYLGKD